MSQVSKLAVIFVNAPFDLNLNVTRLYAYIMSLSKLLKQELLNKLSFLNQPRNFQMPSKNKEGCSLELECFQSRKLQIPVTVSAFYEVNTLHIHFILTSAPSCYCHSFLRRCIFKPSIMQV